MTIAQGLLEHLQMTAPRFASALTVERLHMASLLAKVARELEEVIENLNKHKVPEHESVAHRVLTLAEAHSGIREDLDRARAEVEKVLMERSVERGLAQSAEERVAVLAAEVERLRGLLREVFYSWYGDWPPDFQKAMIHNGTWEKIRKEAGRG